MAIKPQVERLEALAPGRRSGVHRLEVFGHPAELSAIGAVRSVPVVRLINFFAHVSAPLQILARVSLLTSFFNNSILYTFCQCVHVLPCFRVSVRYDMAMKLRSYLYIFAALLLLGPVTTNAAGTASDYLVNFSGFLSAIVLPTIFSIAFLFFIYHTARFFIIDASNQLDREKAKRQAIYGIAAFVFLVSIWAIVTMITSGLNINNSSTVCPDYYKIFNKSCTTQSSDGGFTSLGGASNTTTSGGSTYSGGTNTYTGGTGTYTGGTSAGTSDSTSNTSGSTSGTDTTSSTNTGSSVAYGAPLAELIFGTGKDAAGFHRSLVESTALASTPIIPAVSSCTDAVSTLMLAARTETTQSAYLLYTNSDGALRWQNITDRTSANYIGYDRDVLESLTTAGAHNLYILHVHPDSREDALGLVATGHGPSKADMQLMCTLNDPTITYGTIDETGVWTLTQSSDTCPYTADALTKLASIETYADLAMLEASTRQSELNDYLNDSLTPAAQKNEFSSLNNSTLASLSAEEIIALSLPLQASASTTLTHYTSAASFCSSR